MPLYKYVILGYTEGEGWKSHSVEPGHWKLGLPEGQWTPSMRRPPIPKPRDLPTLLAEGWVPIRETTMGGPVWLSNEHLWFSEGVSALILLEYRPNEKNEYTPSCLLTPEVIGQ